MGVPSYGTADRDYGIVVDLVPPQQLQQQQFPGRILMPSCQSVATTPPEGVGDVIMPTNVVVGENYHHQAAGFTLQTGPLALNHQVMPVEAQSASMAIQQPFSESRMGSALPVTCSTGNISGGYHGGQIVNHATTSCDQSMSLIDANRGQPNLTKHIDSTVFGCLPTKVTITRGTQTCEEIEESLPEYWAQLNGGEQKVVRVAMSQSDVKSGQIQRAQKVVRTHSEYRPIQPRPNSNEVLPTKLESKALLPAPEYKAIQPRPDCSPRMPTRCHVRKFRGTSPATRNMLVPPVNVASGAQLIGASPNTPVICWTRAPKPPRHPHPVSPSILPNLTLRPETPTVCSLNRPLVGPGMPLLPHGQFSKNVYPHADNRFVNGPPSIQPIAPEGGLDHSALKSKLSNAIANGMMCLQFNGEAPITTCSPACTTTTSLQRLPDMGPSPCPTEMNPDDIVNTNIEFRYSPKPEATTAINPPSIVQGVATEGPLPPNERVLAESQPGARSNNFGAPLKWKAIGCSAANLEKGEQALNCKPNNNVKMGAGFQVEFVAPTLCTVSSCSSDDPMKTSHCHVTVGAQSCLPSPTERPLSCGQADMPSSSSDCPLLKDPTQPLTASESHQTKSSIPILPSTVSSVVPLPDPVVPSSTCELQPSTCRVLALTPAVQPSSHEVQPPDSVVVLPLNSTLPLPTSAISTQASILPSSPSVASPPTTLVQPPESIGTTSASTMPPFPSITPPLSSIVSPPSSIVSPSTYILPLPVYVGPPTVSVEPSPASVLPLIKSTSEALTMVSSDQLPSTTASTIVPNSTSMEFPPNAMVPTTTTSAEVVPSNIIVKSLPTSGDTLNPAYLTPLTTPVLHSAAVEAQVLDSPIIDPNDLDNRFSLECRVVLKRLHQSRLQTESSTLCLQHSVDELPAECCRKRHARKADELGVSEVQASSLPQRRRLASPSKDELCSTLPLTSECEEHSDSITLITGPEPTMASSSSMETVPNLTGAQLTSAEGVHSTDIPFAKTEMPSTSQAVLSSSIETLPSSTEMLPDSKAVLPTSTEILHDPTDVLPLVTEVAASSMEISPASVEALDASVEISPNSVEALLASVEMSPALIKTLPSPTEASSSSAVATCTLMNSTLADASHSPGKVLPKVQRPQRSKKKVEFFDEKFSSRGRANRRGRGQLRGAGESRGRGRPRTVLSGINQDGTGPICPDSLLGDQTLGMILSSLELRRKAALTKCTD